MNEARKASRDRERTKLAARLRDDPLGAVAGDLPPNAVRAERAIVRAALDDARTYLAQPARARHCYSELHRRTLFAVEKVAPLHGGRAPLAAVVRELETSKQAGRQAIGIRGDLREIVTGEAWLTPAQIARKGAAVVDAWKRRAHLHGLRVAAVLILRGADRREVATAIEGWSRAVEADGPELAALRARLHAITPAADFDALRRPRMASLDYIRAAKVG